MTTTVTRKQAYPTWEARFAGAVHFDLMAADITSMGVGGRVDMTLYPGSLEDLSAMIRLLNVQDIPHTIVGNRTNLIILAKGYRGALICTKRLDHLEILRITGTSIQIRGEAGVLLSDLVALSARENWTGFEFCAGIPGSIGGAVRMNAGAFGHSISEVVQAVTLMDKQGDLTSMERDKLHFDYRNFHLPEEMMIVETRLQLQCDPKKQVAEKVNKIIEDRKAKHPQQHKNAGSIFKNPDGIPAGQIIESAGLKGLTIGDAMVSEKHANFIINRGHATADDILTLIRHVQQQVHEKMNVSLELEVKLLGED
ncbi:MAG: UDP-N-acetylmuramate dehydrogenase [Syntrophales bacterium]|jgi:UDP-N-acetylmuramate dehydrogenase|nr:UDP-N-acetylmuramate dehydrogenase [Syntrophales bacterium]